ncbi:acyltransferase [Metabacillus sp. FJAT-53654]|uniref:Acyltransferase n=1 Tax=Metabacillus rhizosphaerae TaxID=3117747 RepID=A0ABZ2N0F4_9BACI
MGMKIGDNCSIQSGVICDYSHCWLIKISNNVTIAPQAYLFANDASTKMINNYTKIGSITIEDNVFIGARALIMLGVTIGENSIVAASSIVTKPIPPKSVVDGNPARVITTIDQYEVSQNKKFNDNTTKINNRTYTIGGNISEVSKREV